MTSETKPWRYILSAGRTGTVFLEKLLAEYAPDAVAEHEPKPTRGQMMLANMRNDWGIGHNGLARWFNAARARRDKAHGTYIEVNPFLCAMTDLLPDPKRPIRVVHITREPAGWARSMTVFKASTKFRWFIDYVPFAKPYPSPRPDGWAGWSFYERNLARWAWCNTRIAELEGKAQAYVHIRYEDLFSDDLVTKEAAVMALFDTLGLERPSQIDWSLFETRANPAPPSGAEFDKAAAPRICGDAARRFDYDL
ncbi:hypothetical protein [uncultured Litoreibacter sp.]|uniref:hypothetical protein n=1 Tax=uncultured Litoreibacter sp. TaxID=1392394 RepID=UPI002638B794|nr:hypothetical protein [uncultured Litoreibacter sp.]